MAITFSSLTELQHHGFDTLIDVRSPAEYAEDHVPGAINLPALSNAQRAEVGTIYKQVSPFAARKLGAAMVARNVADHVDGPLAGKDGSWRPLVYCWRGGQRSGSVSTILSQIGWRSETIAGGYQSYRRLVQDYLYNAALPHPIILLDGYTGTAKTAILARLAARGVQTIDLEGLANHRGSLLGAMEGGQPAQRGFETALATAMLALDPTAPVVLEAESSKIGKLVIPPALWYPMRTAPRIVVSAPLEARAAYLTRSYADMVTDTHALASRLSMLRRLRGYAMVDGWLELLRQHAFKDLAESLMREHYDPAYARSRKLDERTIIGEVTAPSLTDDALDRASDAVARIVISTPSAAWDRPEPDR